MLLQEDIKALFKWKLLNKKSCLDSVTFKRQESKSMLPNMKEDDQ